METNEIMTNEEVTEAVETAAEEIVTKGSGLSLIHISEPTRPY